MAMSNNNKFDLPLLLTNLLNAAQKASVVRSLITSKWTALDDRQINIAT